MRLPSNIFLLFGKFCDIIVAFYKLQNLLIFVVPVLFLLSRLEVSKTNNRSL